MYILLSLVEQHWLSTGKSKSQNVPKIFWRFFKTKRKIIGWTKQYYSRPHEKGNKRRKTTTTTEQHAIYYLPHRIVLKQTRTIHNFETNERREETELYPLPGNIKRYWKSKDSSVSNPYLSEWKTFQSYAIKFSNVNGFHSFCNNKSCF